MRIPKSGEFYRHFKNKLYQIVTVAEHTENGEKLVIYQALYGDFKVYARPLEMFMSEVDHEKYPDVQQKYRFMKVELGDTCKEASDSVEIDEQEAAAKPDSEKNDVEAETGIEDGFVEPGFLEFLDEESWDERYNILVSLRDKMTDSLVDSLAVVLDVVIPEGPLDKRYEQLKICLRTRQKYESQHLR